MIDNDQIKIEDISGELSEVAEEIGLEATLRLVKLRGGEMFYVPKMESVTRAARDRSIRAAFNGSNHSELAKKHSLTESHVRSIVRQNADGEDSPNKKMIQTELF